jgi:CheY-like chemotaxis protein
MGRILLQALKVPRRNRWHNPDVSNVIPLNAAASPLRILVVDDHLDGVRSLVQLLRTRGHTVAFAINGFAAMAEAREFKPQVIIVDMRLPDMTGIDVARQLKSEPDLPSVRIIALSGSPEYQKKAADNGLVEFLVKPVPTDVWVALLEGEGGKRAAEDAGER